jgi:hypothetical protein
MPVSVHPDHRRDVVVPAVRLSCVQKTVAQKSVAAVQHSAEHAVGGDAGCGGPYQRPGDGGCRPHLDEVLAELPTPARGTGPVARARQVVVVRPETAGVVFARPPLQAGVERRFAVQGRVARIMGRAGDDRRVECGVSQRLPDQLFPCGLDGDPDLLETGLVQRVAELNCVARAALRALIPKSLHR